MKYSSCTVLTYDDPPAPQELPFQLLPLSPPKRTARPGTSDSSKSSSRSRCSSPLQPSTSPKIKPQRKKTQENNRRTSDSSQHSTSSSISQLIIDGVNTYDHERPKSTDGPTKRLPLDNSPPPKTTRLSVALDNTMTPVLKNIRSIASGAHELLPRHIAAQEVSLANKGNPTTTTSPCTFLTTPDTTISSSPSAVMDIRLPESVLEEVESNTEQTGPGSESVVVGQYEVESDAMSLISRVLDNYCRGFEETDDEDSPLSPDGDVLVVVENTPSTESDDVLVSSSSRKPMSAPASTPQFRHNKPQALIFTSSSLQKEDIVSSLPTLPQTAPSFRRVRPLPQPPASQRRLRPLPRPPVPQPLPPPYSSPISSPISNSSTPSFSYTPSLSQTSSSSLPSLSPPSNNSDTLVTSSSSASSSPKNPTKTDLDTLSSLPTISKRPILPLLIPVSSRDSMLPSPLPPDIPTPPSPMSAKRHQASKLTKMLGEEFPEELVYKRRIITSAMCEPVSRSQTARQQPPISRLRSQSTRPLAIYVDDISEEVELNTSGSENGDSHLNHKRVILDEKSLALSNSLDNESELVPASPSSDCSLVGEDLDLEEAHIGWALQNVVKYEPVSRVKRTSRVWVLERNGERWEEENYCNVLKALRQL